MLSVTETALPGIGLSIPRVIEREAESYLAMRSGGAMRDLPQFAPPLIADLHDWMARRGIVAAGPVFFRYRRLGSDGSVELDVGHAVARPGETGDGVVEDALPAGRYAAATYTGPYDRLHDAFCMLHGWIRARGLEPAETAGPQGRMIGCQLEIYRIGPGDTGDPVKYETDLFLQIA
ncbi:MAG: GyrI-like domain-containing protein [Pseudomonadota bacterium]|nr:GyrI-like domain-containing protein [Pseudomonadota bacterium]